MNSCDNCHAPVLYIPKAHAGLCPPCHSDEVNDRPLGTTQDERYEAQRGAIGLTAAHIDLHYSA